MEFPFLGMTFLSRFVLIFVAEEKRIFCVRTAEPESEFLLLYLLAARILDKI